MVKDENVEVCFILLDGEYYTCDVSLASWLRLMKWICISYLWVENMKICGAISSKLWFENECV